MGTFTIESVHVTGQVQILVEKITRPGKVFVRDLDIQHADSIQHLPQPQGFGVSVLQGAFTLWNLQGAFQVKAEVQGISIGRKDSPANGGGVFLAGFSPEKVDSLDVARLTTGEIFTNGRITPGAPGSTVFISCGVGVFHGAHVADVQNRGAVTTFGDYDMVLDNWGTIDRWVAEKPLTSYGKETAIGFVNYGDIGELSIRAPIETFGSGSRGFNEYEGSMQRAEFDRITTHGNASPGIQISRPVSRLIVNGGIETYGGIGQALHSGKLVELPAYGLNVTDGGEIEEIFIAGSIITHGSFVPPGSAPGSDSVPVPAVELSGRVGTLRIAGVIQANGAPAQRAATP